jgi:hypothetical protein
MQFKPVFVFFNIIPVLTFSIFLLQACYSGNDLPDFALTTSILSTSTTSDSSTSTSDSTTSTSSSSADTEAPTGDAFQINNGDASTSSTLVTLTIDASDNVGVVEMAFRNEATGTWTSWESYAETYPNWDLEVTAEGTYTVFVKFRDAAGNESTPISDSIEYDDTEAPTPVSFAINNGDASSTNYIVTLNLEASDNIGVTEMRFKNETGGTWSSWIPYATTYANWELDSPDDGSYTVYAQYRDAGGNVSTDAAANSFDDITITGSALCVCTTGGFDGAPNDGTPLLPYATISYALTQRTTESLIKVCGDGGGETYDDTFTMIDGVSVWGGYGAGDFQTINRDPVANISILGPTATVPIVTFDNLVTQQTVLDGFTLNAPDVVGSGSMDDGSVAIYIDAAQNVEIRKCIINSGNGNPGHSAGAFIIDLSGDPDIAISDTTITTSTADGNWGGDEYNSVGIWMIGGTLEMTNVTITSGQSIEGDSGGIEVEDTTVIADTCSFTGNISDTQNSTGIYAHGSASLNLVDIDATGGRATNGYSYGLVFANTTVEGDLIIDGGTYTNSGFGEPIGIYLDQVTTASLTGATITSMGPSTDVQSLGLFALQTELDITGGTISSGTTQSQPSVALSQDNADATISGVSLSSGITNTGQSIGVLFSNASGNTLSLSDSCTITVGETTGGGISTGISINSAGTISSNSTSVMIGAAAPNNGTVSGFSITGGGTFNSVNDSVTIGLNAGGLSSGVYIDDSDFSASGIDLDVSRSSTTTSGISASTGGSVNLTGSTVINLNANNTASTVYGINCNMVPLDISGGTISIGTLTTGGAGVQGYGIRVVDADASINNVSITTGDGSRGNIYGINLNTTGTTGITGNSITMGSLASSNHGTYGIRLESLPTANSVVVSDNTIVCGAVGNTNNSMSYGVFASDVIFDTFEDNTITAGDITSGTNSRLSIGLYLDDSTATVLSTDGTHSISGGEVNSNAGSGWLASGIAFNDSDSTDVDNLSVTNYEITGGTISGTNTSASAVGIYITPDNSSGSSQITCTDSTIMGGDCTNIGSVYGIAYNLLGGEPNGLSLDNCTVTGGTITTGNMNNHARGIYAEDTDILFDIDGSTIQGGDATTQGTAQGIRTTYFADGSLIYDSTITGQTGTNGASTASGVSVTWGGIGPGVSLVTFQENIITGGYVAAGGFIEGAGMVMQGSQNIEFVITDNTINGGYDVSGNSANLYGINAGDGGLPVTWLVSGNTVQANIGTNEAANANGLDFMTMAAASSIDVDGNTITCGLADEIIGVRTWFMGGIRCVADVKNNTIVGNNTTTTVTEITGIFFSNGILSDGIYNNTITTGPADSVYGIVTHDSGPVDTNSITLNPSATGTSIGIYVLHDWAGTTDGIDVINNRIIAPANGTNTAIAESMGDVNDLSNNIFIDPDYNAPTYDMCFTLYLDDDGAGLLLDIAAVNNAGTGHVATVTTPNAASDS